MRMFQRFLKDEQGATAIEYGLIVALVVIGAIGGIMALGKNSSGSIGSTATRASEVM